MDRMRRIEVQGAGGGPKRPGWVLAVMIAAPFSVVAAGVWVWGIIEGLA